MPDKKVTARDVVRAQMVNTMAPVHMLQMAQVRSTLLALLVILWFRHRLFANTKDIIVFLAIGVVISWIIRLLGNQSFNRRINAQMEDSLSHFDPSKHELLDRPWPGQDR